MKTQIFSAESSKLLATMSKKLKAGFLCLNTVEALFLLEIWDVRSSLLLNKLLNNVEARDSSFQCTWPQITK